MIPNRTVVGWLAPRDLPELDGSGARSFGYQLVFAEITID